MLPTQSLRVRMLKAAKWVVIGTGCMHLLRLGANLIMTRLLAPEMFGLMAIATTVGVIMIMLSDIGLRQAVIKSPRGDDRIFLDTVWTLEIIRGVVLWAGSLCVAAIIYLLVHFEYINETSTYGNRMLPPLIAAAGFMSVIIGTASTLNLSASRRLDTKLIFVLDVISTLVGICAMLICAWWTRSIWSLIAGSVASTCCGVALSHLYMAGPKNRLRLDRAAIAEIVGFGKWVALSSSITVFVVNSDRLILGALITPHELGLYSIALSLVGALSLVIGQLIDKVMLPAFSQVALRNKDDLPAAYFKMRLYLDPAVLFMSGLLFGIGPLLVSFLYDVRYSQAGNVLSLLALGMVMDRFYLSQQVYMIIGRPQYLAPINAIRLASILCLVPLGFYIDGFYGAVIAVALRDLPVLPLIFWFNSRHHLNRIKTELYLLLCWPVGYFFAFILNSFSISK